MKLHYVFVGKTQFSEIDRMISRYVDRLGRFVKVDVRIVREEKISKSKSDEDVLKVEAERILKCVNSGGIMVVWDRKGTILSSVEYADLIKRWELDGVGNMWMVLGSPIGLGQSVLERADYVLSLSPMTFPHDMARLIVMEQTYRAFTIIRGVPYHR